MMCYQEAQSRSLFYILVFCFCRAETERGLSRKHIIEGKKQNCESLDQMLRLQ